MHQVRALLAAAFLGIGLAACGDEDDAAGVGLPWATCRLEADGSFSLDLGHESGRELLLRGELGQDDPAAQRAALEGLRAVMAGTLRKPEYMDEYGNCRLTLRVDGSPSVRWRYVQWILQTATHPSVHMHAFDLRVHDEGRSTFVDIPYDGFFGEEVEEEGEDLEPRDPGSFLEIKVFRRDFDDPPNAHTLIKVSDTRFEFPVGGRPGQSAYEASMGAVDRAIDEAVGSLDPAASVEFGAPMPKGPHTPYGEVLHLIRRAQAAGDHRILLERTPGPDRGWR